MCTHTRSATVAAAILAVASSAALADVGEIMGAGPGNTFGIKVMHGNSIIIDAPVVPFPSDIKLNDGDGEDFVTLRSVDPDTDYILKIVSDGGPVESWRNTHWYLMSVQPGDVNQPGATSLFDPNISDPISVEINNIAFAGTLTATPTLLNHDSYYAAFMRNQPGHFYQLPESKPFNNDGFGLWDVQVRGPSFYDAGAPYDYSATSGPVVGWSWQNLFNPGPATQVYDAAGNLLPSDAGFGGATKGFVHEVGMAMSFTGTLVPEPSMAILMLGSLTWLVRRRR